MVMSAARFNCIQPGLEPTEMSARYRAFVEMAGYAEANGFAMLTLEEHHGADNGWSPSPLIMAGLIFGQTKNIGVNISALLLPLHDPLRVAEDIAVLDNASGGRLTTILGIGYRPEEYAAHGKDWDGRGRLLDECVDTLLKAWTGEPFEYRGTTVRVTPTPLTKPHPMIGIGGTSKPAARRAARVGLPFLPARTTNPHRMTGMARTSTPAARRAARFGLPFLPARTVPGLADYYYAQCAEHGVDGFCIEPGQVTVMLHVAEDPDKAWAEIGEHF